MSWQPLQRLTILLCGSCSQSCTVNLQHMGLELLKNASRGCEALNPVALSTQLSEVLP